MKAIKESDEDLEWNAKFNALLGYVGQQPDTVRDGFQLIVEERKTYQKKRWV